MEDLAAAIRNGIVLLDCDSQDMDDVLLDVVHQSVQAGRVPRSLQETILKKLRNREALDSTAIGHGVAIPHAYVDSDLESSVVFVRLKHPLDVRAIDGEPARYLFVLIGHAGEVDTHLNMLAAVARAMSDPELRACLKDASSAEEVVDAFERFQNRRSSFGTASIMAEEPELRRPEGFGDGLSDDIRGCWPHIASDLKDGLHPKSAAAVLFLTLFCFAQAVFLGQWTGTLTGQTFGVTEMLTAAALCGTVTSLTAGQSLLIPGAAGPLLLFTALLYRLCQVLQIPFSAVWGWVGLWTAVLTVLLAFSGVSWLSRHVTRFTLDVFTSVMALAFAADTARILLADLGAPSLTDAAALPALTTAAGTFLLAIGLRRFRVSRYLAAPLRMGLSQAGPVVAVLLLTAFSRRAGDGFDVPLISNDVSAKGLQAEWTVLTDVPLWVCLGAAGPGLLAALLVFVLQNLAGRTVRLPNHRLNKRTGYHLDLFVTGVLIGICSLMRLPWMVAAVVPSLCHVHSLATIDDDVVPGGSGRWQIRSVVENRLTGLIVHLLLGVSLIWLPELSRLPAPVFWGLLLYGCVLAVSGTGLADRIRFWLSDPHRLSDETGFGPVPADVIARFTGVQIVCLAGLWILQISPAGVLLPLAVVLLVPVRRLLNAWFLPEHLAILDGDQAARNVSR